MVIAGDLLQSDFIKLDANDTVARFLNAIKKTGDTFGLIFEGKSYRGFADKKELLHSRSDASVTKVKHCLKHVPLLTKNAKLADIVRLMATADVRALPVRDDNKIIGVVRAKDVMRELRDFYQKIRVADVVKRRVVVCNDDDTIGKTINLMVQRNVDRVPVVDKKGIIVGIVSLIDVLTRFSGVPKQRIRLSHAAAHNQWGSTGYQVGEKQSLLHTPVSNEMTNVCWTCMPTVTVTEAIDIMIEHDLSSLVVAEKEKPVGMLTIKDLFEYYRKRL